ncbi:MAG: alpha/beta hydrolase [Pirellulaceae bacterium]|nr:alpha/beta hydrolase [Pirellulaceae bacterium]
MTNQIAKTRVSTLRTYLQYFLIVGILGCSFCVEAKANDESAARNRSDSPKAIRKEKKQVANRADKQGQIPVDLKVVDNIIFKSVADVKLVLMLFVPAERKFEKSPLVVYFHGGGWGGGDKSKIFGRDLIEVIRELNKRGVTCASVEYRLANGGPATANESVADCKDAVRFLAHQAVKYGLDSERIGTFGSSAGGHLTLVTALGNDQNYPCDPTLNDSGAKICCVAAYYPMTSFVRPELLKGSNFERPARFVPILGGLPDTKRDLALKLSPIELLTPQSPSIFLAHGDNDEVLSVKNSTALRDAAHAIGVPVECYISKGAGHGFRGDSIEPSIATINARTVDFFMRYLGPNRESQTR